MSRVFIVMVLLGITMSVAQAEDLQLEPVYVSASIQDLLGKGESVWFCDGYVNIYEHHRLHSYNVEVMRLRTWPTSVSAADIDSERGRMAFVAEGSVVAATLEHRVLQRWKYTGSNIERILIKADHIVIADADDTYIYKIGVEGVYFKTRACFRPEAIGVDAERIAYVAEVGWLWWKKIVFVLYSLKDRKLVWSVPTGHNLHIRGVLFYEDTTILATRPILYLYSEKGEVREIGVTSDIEPILVGKNVLSMFAFIEGTLVSVLNCEGDAEFVTSEFPGLFPSDAWKIRDGMLVKSKDGIWYVHVAKSGEIDIRRVLWDVDVLSVCDEKGVFGRAKDGMYGVWQIK